MSDGAIVEWVSDLSSTFQSGANKPYGSRIRYGKQRHSPAPRAMASEPQRQQPVEDPSAFALTMLLCASAGTSVGSFSIAFAQNGNALAHPCLLAFTLIHLALLGLAGRTLQRFVLRRRRVNPRPRRPPAHGRTPRPAPGCGSRR